MQKLTIQFNLLRLSATALQLLQLVAGAYHAIIVGKLQSSTLY